MNFTPIGRSVRPFLLITMDVKAMSLIIKLDLTIDERVEATQPKSFAFRCNYSDRRFFDTRHKPYCNAKKTSEFFERTSIARSAISEMTGREIISENGGKTYLTESVLGFNFSTLREYREEEDGVSGADLWINRDEFVAHCTPEPLLSLISDIGQPTGDWVPYHDNLISDW